MAKERAISYLEHIKLEDGSYVIKFPITTAKEVILNIETGETVEQVFNNVVRQVEAESYTLLEDFATLVGKIAGLVDDNINSNHIFRDNMKTDDLITVLFGRFQPGSVSNGTDAKLSYTMKQPLVLKDKPIKMQLKDIVNVSGDFKYDVKMTFNALDTNPTWLDCTEAYKNQEFVNLTEAYQKEDGKDWAINFIFTAERTGTTGTIEVVDYMLLHL